MSVAVLGWGLAVLSSLTVVPQLRRLRKTGSSEGVSLSTAGMATATMWAWCVYTVEVADWPAFASSVVPLAVWSSIAGVVLSHRRDRRSVVVALIALATMTFTALSGAAVLVATAGSLVWIIPQGLRTLRTPSLHAVSVSAYLLILVENVGWVLYALATGRLAYAAAPLVQIPMSALIAHRARTRRTAPAAFLDSSELTAVP